MIINQYYNFYTNQVSNEVADELIARIDALSALNRNVSEFGSSKQFYAVRDKTKAKPELLRKFQEWRDRKIAYGEVRAFRKVSQCCNGKLAKDTEQAPFVVTVKYEETDGMVPSGFGDVSSVSSDRNSYGDIKYSVSEGLNKPSLYNNQPQAFLQSINVSNEGYAGVVQRVTIKMRVFTREAFEIIDKWFLRPGNEMLVKYGWSVPLTSMETSSDVIHAVIFNFNATLTDDMGWIVTVHGIAKGNLAVGLTLGSAAEETAALNNSQLTQQEQPDQNVIPYLTTILKDELSRIRVGFPGVQNSDNTPEYDRNVDLVENEKPYGIIYESDIFPHGIGRLKFSVDGSPQEQAVSQIPPTQIVNDKRKATTEEFDQWLEGFRRENPRFTQLESEFGKKSPQAFIKFYEGNFGLVEDNLVFSDVIFPDRANPSLIEEFVNKDIFYSKDGIPDELRTTLGGISNQQQNAKYAKTRPPVGPLRRKVLDIMYRELPDNRSEAQRAADTQEAELDRQLEEIRNQQGESGAVNITSDIDYRITDANSSTRYYICLGDLVYFFNEKVFKQAPELYTAVQLLVENQPTSYDPNIVSCLPTDVMFSNAKNLYGGMSAYGDYNKINYGFKYKKLAATNELVLAHGCDGVDFYPDGEFLSKDDMEKHQETWGLYLNENQGEKIAAFNIAHIWVSVDVISEVYSNALKDKALDPQYRTVFDFFEQIFSRIAQASANIIQLTLIPDSNQLYSNRGINSKTLDISNPLLTKTQLFRIVDVNFQPPHNLPYAPKSFDFKVNDVNATILRDVNVSLKLPSKLQTVAYTYGRAGMNEDIVDVQDDSGICESDYSKLIEKRNEILSKLSRCKNLVAENMSQKNIARLIDALGAYAANPVPVTDNRFDTSKSVSVHQGWLYNKLYPVELQFKLDGIAGFLYGNKVNILNALPSRYANSVYFTLTKIEHEIQNNDWVTTLTAIARLKNSHGLLQFPNIITQEGRKDLCEKVKQYDTTQIITPIDSTGGTEDNTQIEAIPGNTQPTSSITTTPSFSPEVLSAMQTASSMPTPMYNLWREQSNINQQRIIPSENN